jgi:hypothetical protein
MRIRIRIDRWSIDPPGLHFDPPGLHCERRRLCFEPIKLLNLTLISDPDPASKNNADPSGSATLLTTVCAKIIFIYLYSIAGIAPFFVENVPELQLAALKLVTGMKCRALEPARQCERLIVLKNRHVQAVHCTVARSSPFSRAPETNMFRLGIEPGSPSKELFEQLNTINIRNFYICRPEPQQYLYYLSTRKIWIPMDMVL